ncbi:MAG: hypothetical protein GEU75_03365 [Dehalococcoidia bacterium]|nr:hypothetical protein [Dehalococcoidia bacterium]
MSERSSALEAEIGRVVQRTRRIGAEAAFRAAIEERLRGLESEMSEVKSRLNGLLFFIASTVIAQVVLRIWA